MAHVPINKTQSLLTFAGQGDNAAKLRMKKLMESLVRDHPDDGNKEAFKSQMEAFVQLFSRYISQKANATELNWDKISTPKVDRHEDLPKVPQGQERDALSKLVVLKLNGGLGTSMGCVGPKSAIEVKGGMTFLDLTVRQIEFLNNTYDCDVPLILMNSFNTDLETDQIIQKYSQHNVNILTFSQSKYPRFTKESNHPLPDSWNAEKHAWYPPGHGDMYESFYRSGLLDSLLSQGKEYVFVSNIDNLGATVDLRILNHLLNEQSEFLMEVTDKTRSDVKGGTIIDYDGNTRLLEIAQVPPEHVDDFKSVSKFKIFNTNNLWISIPAIKRVVKEKTLSLDIIVNPKVVPETGVNVIQLETAVGAAIRHFKNGHGINVPRSRFLPVKGTSDLLLVQSDLYRLSHGTLVMNPLRSFKTVPIVKLGDDFKKVEKYLSRFKTSPKILELDHLTVTGDVVFGSNVTLKGTVIIVANYGEHIDIPSGSILENKVVSGNLRILDH
eukprot:NODE_307_length_1675_cov_72.510982_g275_i0.p1 GENE.NODE_307_length_1675_cov_72.510982_g275_i0~~NODE_307_length_1675_cov_72.510982_g275_i0.p1  ORF type:complete len:497 (+),score=103.48 NODE_307_length_1675_cov_72.510982_g275_i0:65-1555(+)